ncbi:unnamed protein product [Symbiodinium pilosum]|uniref:Uncharacterized protein n=1 Tax=Symbiodinium pilosum TaxID=2952 RepID=A0A812V7S7_SYMPI|nr:unnamed protein product [Symbiodinium pilosum]
MNNSTDALVRLWRMCVTSQGNCPEQGLQWDRLRQVMEGLPMARCEALRANSVDDILTYHFGDTLNYVNFTLFWRGMEALLQTAGVFNNGGFDESTLEVIASLRQFRDEVLELLNGRDDECSVRELRNLYCERLRGGGLWDHAVIPYWEEKLQQLPKDDEMVSADEISAAMLQWLEDLLGYGEASEAHLINNRWR